ncbi:TRAF-type zinc finger domain-containing protein 1-like isoform X2 [Protopterus annectens]|uniref:TRAF-type zinc finger domain-containing protein 1-like isoform X2 n=1 Tax=Protopterus annectens TaxID=7888 RepID=UPI001CFAA40E|nr:TRAF-type zinc finger domain-containing protein 1-like isoform X2 [Protopterus annectens]
MDVNSETKYCRNCEREIAGSNFIIHEAHCVRTIVLCEVCKEPVSKDMLQDHKETQHQEVMCKCGMKMEKKVFEKHQAEECMLQTIPCEFCKMEVELRNFPEHQNYCGSRTDLCPLCQKRITYFDMEQHCETCTGPDTTPHPSGRPADITEAAEAINTDNIISAGESITRTLTQFLGPTMLEAFNQMASPQNTSQAHVTASSTWSENTGPSAAVAAMNNLQTLYTSRAVQTLTRAILDRCDLDQSETSVNSDQMHRWFSDPQPEERDDALVPCQFCEALIPFQDILLHQSACAQDTTPSTTESLNLSDFD